MEVRWMTSREAARHLNVSPRTLHNWTKQGKLEVTRVGRIIRYSMQALDAFMALHRASRTEAH